MKLINWLISAWDGKEGENFRSGNPLVCIAKWPSQALSNRVSIKKSQICDPGITKNLPPS